MGDANGGRGCTTHLLSAGNWLGAKRHDWNWEDTGFSDLLSPDVLFLRGALCWLRVIFSKFPVFPLWPSRFVSVF